jgi:putative ABC transport system permease protein
MFKSYLKIACRNIRRQKLYSAINILGLTIALSVSLLIFLYVYDEFSYDRFHEHADRIVQLGLRGRTSTSSITPPEIVPLFSELPEVEMIVRFERFGSSQVVRHGDKLFSPEVIYATENFFDVFTYSFLAGDPRTALSEKYSVVLTESWAKRYFGEEPALGKTLFFNHLDGWYDDDQPFIVTGVIEDVPLNTSFPFDGVASYKSLGMDLKSFRWSQALLLLREGVSLADVRVKVPALYRKYFGQRDQIALMKPEEQEGFILRPITAIHFQSRLDRNWIPGGGSGDMQYQLILITIGFLLVVIACINYMNLATARATGRVREIGVRKVAGAFRNQLIVQHLTESMVFTGIAFLLAIFLAYYCLPALNHFAEKSIHMTYLIQRPVMLGLIGGIILVGLLAGTYPALYLTAFPPVDMLRRTMTTGQKGNLLRSILVVWQFSFSVAMIAFGLLAYQQLEYMRHKDLGFDKESVIIVNNTHQMGDHQGTFLEEVRRQSQVVTVGSVTTRLPGRLVGSWSWSYFKRPGEVDLNTCYADPGFIETMGIELLAGRNLSRDESANTMDHGFGSKYSKALLNEAAVRALGWPDPIGRSLYKRHRRNYQDENGEWHSSYPIVESQGIGIIEDFHFLPFQRFIYPLIVLILPAHLRQCAVIRVQPGDTQATLKTIKATWKQFQPKHPFVYYFLDEQFKATHRKDLNFGALIGFFTVLSILIACLGMLGLAASTAECRTKEIGIRKVLGASVPEIVRLLCTDTVKWVAIACVIGLPVAYVIGGRWLNNFAYRIDIGAAMFILAGITALMIALFTVSTQALRAATTNPVDSLRYE